MTEGLRLDDLLALRRNLTSAELLDLLPRLTLAAQTLVQSLRNMESCAAEIRQAESSEPLLTAEQAAEILNLHESFVRQCGRDGRIKTVKLGVHVRYRRSEIERVAREGVAEAAGPSSKVADLAARRRQRSNAHAA